MIQENSNAGENFERMNHSDYRLRSASKRRRGRIRTTASTASLALAVTKLLALSQHGTPVGAFTYSQKKMNVPRAKTEHVKHIVQPRFLSSLNYRDIDSEIRLENTPWKYHIEIFRLFTAKTAAVHSQTNDEHSSSSQKDDQNDVDDYLEYLSRRYNRVHQNESKSDESPKGFYSALAWLNAHEIKDQTEDALCVLDLAKLASKRLLHKHHLLVKKSKQQHLSMDKVVITSDERLSGNNISLSIRNFLNPLSQRLSRICALKSVTTVCLATKIMTGGELASQFAILIACSVVMTGSWKA